MNKVAKKIKNLHIVQNYRSIYPYVKPYWIRALLAILVTFPVGTMDAVIAWSLKPYTDVVMIEKNLSSSAYIPLLIIVFSVLQSGFNYSASYLNAWAGAKISNGLKHDLLRKLMRCEAAFFDKSASGFIQMRFNTDVDTACSGLLRHVNIFTTRIFSSLSLIGVLFVNSWQLAIVAMIVLIIALYPLSTIRKRISSIVGKTLFSSAGIATYYIEAFNGNRIIMSYNLYDYQMQRFSSTLEEAFRLGIKMVQRTGILSPMMHSVISIGIAAIIWMGGYLIANHQLTAGGFVSFITAVLLLYQPVKSMGNDFNSVQQSLIAMERVFELLKKAPAIMSKQNAVRLESIKNSIEYKGVEFEYAKGNPTLKKVNLKIKIGQTVALVGNSGGGKTTFVNLLPRFYDIKSGSIMIDGLDIRDLELDSLRAKIAVVFQDNFLFTGTIRENILLGKEKASVSELNLAVESACLSEFVKNLDKGLDTEIGERGILLSGGQKQRVAIARAFLKNAPIVILDEATSSLDNKSEAVVQRAIENLMKDRTVFIVAHRLSTVKNADKIVVINNGEIVESGVHRTLIAKKNGIYASLYNTQLI
ncbi:MAG: ABC transporter ATP-binding protein/permease [Holosporaceae bacterium]|jgi:subfamily B ATP-binding cassette protein MsbA|nr:ABC transporter ATP-binding protein/permease [Holosporaceae bacterium]